MNAIYCYGYSFFTVSHEHNTSNNEGMMLLTMVMPCTSRSGWYITECGFSLAYRHLNRSVGDRNMDSVATIWNTKMFSFTPYFLDAAISPQTPHLSHYISPSLINLCNAMVSVYCIFYRFSVKLNLTIRNCAYTKIEIHHKILHLMPCSYHTDLWHFFLYPC